MNKVFILVTVCFFSTLSFGAENKSSTSYKNEKMAVLDFGGNAREWTQEAAANMLESKLTTLNRFQILNRRNMKAILEEYKVNMSGIVNEKNAAEIGKQLSVNKLVLGTIDFINVESEHKDGKTTYSAEVAVTIKIISVEKNILEQSFTTKGGSSGSNESKSITNAMENAIDNLILEIRTAYSLNAQIIKIEGKTAYINLGHNSGMKKGVIFEIFRLGKEIVDPITGESLGADSKTIGMLRITSVHDKYSQADILKGRYLLNVGDNVKESAGFALPELYIMLSYENIPSNVGRAPYYGISVGTDPTDFPIGWEWRTGILRADNSTGWAMDLGMNLIFPIVPEFIDAYIGGSVGFALMFQNLKNPDEVRSRLASEGDGYELDGNSTMDASIGYKGSVGLKLRVIQNIQPYAEVSFNRYNDFNDFSFSHTTGETDDEGNDETEYMTAEETDLKNPIISIGGVAVRLGLSFQF